MTIRKTMGLEMDRLGMSWPLTIAPSFSAGSSQDLGDIPSDLPDLERGDCEGRATVDLHPNVDQTCEVRDLTLSARDSGSVGVEEFSPTKVSSQLGATR